MRHKLAFTLAELLIALFILGVIATFTIPKVLIAHKNQSRYSKAMEVAAALTAITRTYVMENHGCLPHMTCKFDPSTGIPLDGEVTHSDGSTDPAAFNNLQSYLDKRLNYLRKISSTTYPGSNLYLLPNGTVVAIQSISLTGWTASSPEVAVSYILMLDSTPEDMNAGNISYPGVDSQSAGVYVYRHGGLRAGMNSQQMSIGLPYDDTASSIFDLKDHPDDTCIAIGGTNCGM